MSNLLRFFLRAQHASGSADEVDGLRRGSAVELVNRPSVDGRAGVGRAAHTGSHAEFAGALQRLWLFNWGPAFKFQNWPWSGF